LQLVNFAKYHKARFSTELYELNSVFPSWYVLRHKPSMKH